MTPEQIQLWLQLGVGGLLLVALFVGARKVWVFGWVHEAALAALREQVAAGLIRENEWKALALRLLPVAEKSTALAEAAVKKNGNGSP